MNSTKLSDVVRSVRSSPAWCRARTALGELEPLAVATFDGTLAGGYSAHPKVGTAFAATHWKKPLAALEREGAVECLTARKSRAISYADGTVVRFL